MRLIDADKIGFTGFELFMMTQEKDNWKYAYQALSEKISRAPIIDAVPVVRCKDCKYHTFEEPGMVYCPLIVFGGWVQNDWYCADGERRSDND